MKNIKLGYGLLLLLLSGLWLVAENPLAAPYAFFALRSAFVNYTGIIGIGVMSVAMLLSLRPVWLEPYLGGLDKMYRLHKWLGITGLVFAISHWLWAKAPKWLIGWGWLQRPVRHPPAAQPEAVLRWFQQQRGLAESIGEWSFYALVLLLALALLKRFPYRHFFKTHRLLPLLYLLLVFHAVVLMKFSYWQTPTAPLLALLMLGASAAAVLSLTKKVGAKRQAVGTIETLQPYPDSRVLKVGIRLADHWPGHAAGQFAFLRFAGDEAAHPFTISSAWHDDGRLLFLIKELGDYTRTLPATLQLGDGVTLEGPYGQFNFDGAKPRQIWVAGGIGITPFIARMHALASQPDGKPVDLFYCSSVLEDSARAKLQGYAQQAGVRLHLLVGAQDGRLDAARITRQQPHWPDADLWFCGPAGFARTLRQEFATLGLPATDFHQEWFQMR